MCTLRLVCHFQYPKTNRISKPHVEQLDLKTPLFQYVLETWQEQQLF